MHLVHGTEIVLLCASLHSSLYRQRRVYFQITDEPLTQWDGSLWKTHSLRVGSLLLTRWQRLNGFMPFYGIKYTFCQYLLKPKQFQLYFSIIITMPSEQVVNHCSIQYDLCTQQKHLIFTVNWCVILDSCQVWLFFTLWTEFT